MFKYIFVWFFVISSICSASALYSDCQDVNGLPGLCTKKDKCISNKEAYNVYGIRALSCGKYKECCINPAWGTPKWKEGNAKRISALRCNKINTPELSYLIAIGWLKKPAVYDYRCIGTLISPDFVLTSASCVKSKPDSVKLGFFWNEPNEMIMAYVEEYIPHENFDRATFTNDIALLKLISPPDVELPYTCLWQTDAVYGGRLLSFNIEPGLTPHLKSVNVNIPSHDNKILDDENESKVRLTSFTWNSGRAAGGGPVIAKIENIAYIVAITPIMDNIPKYEKKYTKVSYYLNWIENHVWKTNYYLQKYIDQNEIRID